MITASGMTIRHDHQNEYWPEEILWPVVKSFTQPGWRTGATRVYTLKCGHYYTAPASSAEGRGATAKCVFCTQVWRWITTQSNSGGVDHALKTINPDILAQMHRDAHQIGRLAFVEAECGGSGPHLGNQVRLLPHGKMPLHGNDILCRACHAREIIYRKERNQKLADDAKYDLPDWNDLEVSKTEAEP